MAHMSYHAGLRIDIRVWFVDTHWGIQGWYEVGLGLIQGVFLAVRGRVYG